MPDSWNVKASRWFDRFLPPEYRIDGSSHFRSVVVPEHAPGARRIIDFGAGRIPVLADKNGAHVTGIDLSLDEMQTAPAGAYDEIIAADATTWVGRGEADLIISHCLFEHVNDTAGAWRAVASGLAPGGSALVFAPCGNALFARINLLVQSVAAPIKNALIHGGGTNNGWYAHYNRCTPKLMARSAREAGLEVVSVRAYWSSGYLVRIPPAHALWRLYQRLTRLLAGDEAAESFAIQVRKPLA